MKRRNLLGIMAVMTAVSLISAAPKIGMAAATGETPGKQSAATTGTAPMGAQGTAGAQGAQVTGIQTEAAEDYADLQERLKDSTEVINTMMTRPEEKIPPQVLANSTGIAIFPDVTKVAFGIGGRYGGGVLMLNQNKEWRGPIFISLYGASVGAQLGAEQSDLIMVFTNSGSLQKFSDGELQLGAEASVAAGPWGAKVGASTQADVLAYKQTAGLFAGVALSGAVLNVGEENNKLYYSKASKDPYPGDEKVFTGNADLPKSEQAASLLDVLKKYVQQK